MEKSWNCIFEFLWEPWAVKKTLYPLLSTDLTQEDRGGLVVECLTRDQGFEPHRRHCVVSLGKTH